MSIRQLTAFFCSIALVAFLLMGVLHAVDASATVTGLSIALFAVAVGTASTLLEGRSALPDNEARVTQHRA